MRIRLTKGFPALLVALLLTLAGCDWDSAGGSLFDPDYEPSRPDPAVTMVEPTATSLAGVGRVVIHGSNFSPDADENVVLFDDERATVWEASPERLVVRVPNLVGDDVKLRVSVLGAIHFSEERPHRLIPAVVARGGFAPEDSPRGMVVDEEGNVYVALMRGPLPQGIFRIAAGSNQAENIVPAEGWTYVDMTMHPDGDIFMARGALAAIYTVGTEGGTPQVWLFRPALGPINRVEADQFGNIWAGGTSGNVHHITPDQDVTSHPFEGDIRALAYEGGHLYVSAVRNNEGGLWRASVTASGAGSFDRILNFADHTALQGASPAGIEVREDGSVFLATSRGGHTATQVGYSLLHVQPDGSWESFYGVLPSMQPTMTALSLGPDNYLYAARQGEGPGVYRIDLQWREGR